MSVFFLFFFSQGNRRSVPPSTPFFFFLLFFRAAAARHSAAGCRRCFRRPATRPRGTKVGDIFWLRGCAHPVPKDLQTSNQSGLLLSIGSHLKGHRSFHGHCKCVFWRARVQPGGGKKKETLHAFAQVRAFVGILFFLCMHLTLLNPSASCSFNHMCKVIQLKTLLAHFDAGPLQPCVLSLPSDLCTCVRVCMCECVFDLGREEI